MIPFLLLAAAAQAAPPAPAAPTSPAEEMAAFQQSLKQRGFSDAGIRSIVAAAPQGAAQAQALQAQGEAAVTELRTVAAANPVDVPRITSLMRRLDDLRAQLARLGTDATIRNLQTLSEADRRLLLETMGLRGNPPPTGPGGAPIAPPPPRTDGR